MDYLRLVKLEGEKRQRTGAVQNLAECVATLNCAKRFGVRQSSGALAPSAIGTATFQSHRGIPAGVVN